jgi:hypothetical protein
MTGLTGGVFFEKQAPRKKNMMNGSIPYYQIDHERAFQILQF